jgi:hypothetical protein
VRPFFKPADSLPVSVHDSRCRHWRRPRGFSGGTGAEPDRMTSVVFLAFKLFFIRSPWCDGQNG